MLPEINTYAHNKPLCVCHRGKVRKKTKRKRGKRASIAPAAPVYIYSVYTSLAVNMFTRKTRCPSQKLTLKPVHNPFAKFINVKEGTVVLLAREKKKNEKKEKTERSALLAYQQNISVMECDGV